MEKKAALSLRYGSVFFEKKQMPSRRSSHGLLSDLRIATAGKGRAVGLAASCRLAPRTEQASRMRDEPKGRIWRHFRSRAAVATIRAFPKENFAFASHRAL